MTALANQLRSAFHLASRDAYVKGAFVLPALLVVLSLLVLLFSNANVHVMFEGGCPQPHPRRRPLRDLPFHGGNRHARHLVGRPARGRPHGARPRGGTWPPG